MISLTPRDATVIPLRYKLASLKANDVSKTWFKSAVHVLRGDDGGEHGLLLYKLVRALETDNSHTVLDIGTARGFSAITMARALIDANLEGKVLTVDVIDHQSRLKWHVEKQDSKDPLVSMYISRAEVWGRWFSEEAGLVTAISGKSQEVLVNWGFGSIDVAFIDGEHTYEAVKRDLALLDNLMTPEGVIVLDDYHTGMSMGAFRSRPLNGAVILIGRAAKHIWPSMQNRLKLGSGNEFLVVKRRFAGVYRAVNDFLAERSSHWELEIVTMPPRGAYHEADYSLALLTRRNSVSA